MIKLNNVWYLPTKQCNLKTIKLFYQKAIHVNTWTGQRDKAVTLPSRYSNTAWGRGSRAPNAQLQASALGAFYNQPQRQGGQHYSRSSKCCIWRAWNAYAKGSLGEEQSVHRKVMTRYSLEEKSFGERDWGKASYCMGKEQMTVLQATETSESNYCKLPENSSQVERNITHRFI